MRDHHEVEEEDERVGEAGQRVVADEAGRLAEREEVELDGRASGALPPARCTGMNLSQRAYRLPMNIQTIRASTASVKTIAA